MASAEREKALRSAARGAGYNMILQMAFRVATFVLNAFVLRRITKDLLGVVNVRLALLSSTGLFLSREAFRRACLSKTEGEGRPNVRYVVNLMWMTVPLGALLTSAMAVVWTTYLEQPSPDVVPGYKQAVWVFALGCTTELIAEPLFVLAQSHFMVRIKVLVEGAALGLRCLLTGVLVAFFPEWGIYSFCLAYILYASVMVGLYYIYFAHLLSKAGGSPIPLKSFRDLFPTPVPGQPWYRSETWISPQLAELARSFFTQSFYKQFLTEGERYVMTIFNVLSFGQQGVYDVINNLGSLVARFIFLPIEENYYVFFTSTLQRGASKQQASESVSMAASTLSVLLKFVILLGLIIVTFGWSYSHLLLELYGGSSLSSGEGPLLLRSYCAYVLVLAVNGITECFFFATMSKDEVDRYNHKMLLFSFLLLISSWQLTKWLGGVGFILANCVQMCARIAHSLRYIQTYFSSTPHQPIRSGLPSAATLACLLVSGVLMAYSETRLCCDFGLTYAAAHVALGMACLAVVLLCIFVKERDLLSFIHSNFLKKVQ